MKIKCPLCDFETVDRDNITMHIENKHHLTLDVLVFKIHEKIESLQNQYDQDVIENNDDDYPSVNGAQIYKAIRELKSLLEDKK